MDASTLTSRLETATASFRSLERQLADPDVANDPKRLETIARERSRLEPLVLDNKKNKKIKKINENV
jgi:peptide chain release factor 1